MRTRLALAAIAIWAALTSAAAAQGQLRLAEQDIKAGLLYNFLRYTQWPGPAAPSTVVCVLGSDPFSGRLQPMAGRSVNQSPIEIRAVSTLTETDSCALLFINNAERARWPQVRAHLAGRHVLTVSDYDGFAESGGMIEFGRVNNRIRVRINIDAVGAARLTVQDRMLRLAETVGGGQP